MTDNPNATDATVSGLVMDVDVDDVESSSLDLQSHVVVVVLVDGLLYSP